MVYGEGIIDSAHSRAADDRSCEEIARELAFDGTTQQGIARSDAGRVIPKEEMGRRIRSWQKITWTAEAPQWLEDMFEHIAGDNPQAADAPRAGRG